MRHPASVGEDGTWGDFRRLVDSYPAGEYVVMDGDTVRPATPDEIAGVTAELQAEADAAAAQALLDAEARKDQIATEQLEKHPELAVVMNGFLTVCSVVNGLDPWDTDCRMGFPELLNVKTAFPGMTPEQQMAVLERAALAGFEGTPAEVLGELAEQLVALNMWGLRYDVLEPDLQSVGGWWAVCRWTD